MTANVVLLQNFPTLEAAWGADDALALAKRDCQGIVQRPNDYTNKVTSYHEGINDEGTLGSPLMTQIGPLRAPSFEARRRGQFIGSGLKPLKLGELIILIS